MVVWRTLRRKRTWNWIIYFYSVVIYYLPYYNMHIDIRSRATWKTVKSAIKADWWTLIVANHVNKPYTESVCEWLLDQWLISKLPTVITIKDAVKWDKKLNQPIVLDEIWMCMNELVGSGWFKYATHSNESNLNKDDLKTYKFINIFK